MHRAALALVLAVALYFANLGRANACSCVESGGVPEALTAAGSVFEGKVTLLRHEPKQHRLTARVQVLRRWKGAADKSVDVVTIDEGSLCGFGFERGKSYLLFTPEAQGTLSVGLCSRSKASESAAADFAELDRLAASTNNAPAPAPSASAEPVAPAPPVAATPTPQALPAPSPAPEPSSATTASGRGGCAGCSAPSTAAPPGLLAALALVLAGLFRRCRASPS